MGQLSFKLAGIFALYFGVVVGPAGLDDGGAVVVLALLSKVAVGPGPSYGSSVSGLLSNLTISCDKPIGLFGAGDLAGACGPVRALEDAEVLGAFGKKLSEV